MDLSTGKLLDDSGQFVLLNAYAADSSGLYNGKAGLSLVLFELSIATDNDVWGDHAYELISQALITSGKNTSFANGLSGIGYALLYLIDNNFIDADFDGLFGEKRNQITKVLKDEIKKGNYRPLTQELFYLNALGRRRNKEEGKLLHTLRKKIIEGYMERINKARKRENKIHKLQLKRSFLLLLKQYLNTGNPADGALHELCRNYAELYDSGLIASDLTVGLYFKKFAKKIKEKKLRETAMSNIHKGIENFHVEVFTFEEKIELLFLLSFNEGSVENSENLISELTSSIIAVKGKTTEQSIADSMPPSVIRYGLGHGASRLLVWLIYKTFTSAGEKTDAKRLWNLLV
jgi:hypothetical protein